MLRVQIKKDERDHLFKDGDYVKCLQPGKYLFNPSFVNYSLSKADINQCSWY